MSAVARSRSYVCLVCGAAMLERACRVRCPRCGYFEDCENGLTPPPVESGRAGGIPEAPGRVRLEAES